MANISGYIDYAASVKAPSKTDDELYTLLGTNSKGSVVNIDYITEKGTSGKFSVESQKLLPL